MKKKILVYDNQLGYYDLLKRTIKNGFEFSLFDENYHFLNSEDIVIFFLYDELELLDLVKLYREDVPFIVGCSKTHQHCLSGKENIYTINLGQTKDEIIKSLYEIFNIIQQTAEKEEAL